MRIESGGSGAHAVRLLIPAGKRNQRHTLRSGLLAQAPCGFITVHAGHAEFVLNDFGTEARNGFQRRPAIVSSLRISFYAAQQCGEAVGGISVVVHHENAIKQPLWALWLRGAGVAPRMRQRTAHDEFGSAASAGAQGFDAAAMELRQLARQREADAQAGGA